MSNSWWEELGKPTQISAPMVKMSELPFRMLLRKYGAQLCYTPMFHAKLFVTSEKYRKINFTTCQQDRPLAVQFCANDPEYFSQAALLVENDCDFVDLNLGCPQNIAKNGHYGAYLLDEMNLICDMIKRARECCKIPISCKIRILKTVEDTLELIKKMENSGCQLITIHARTIHQRGANTGLPNIDIVKILSNSINIPFIYNGGIVEKKQIQPFMDEIGCDGIMVAEALLYNPLLWSGLEASAINVAFEYLEFCELYNEGYHNIRGHLFKLFRHFICDFPYIRAKICLAHTIVEYKNVMKELEYKVNELSKTG